MKLNLDDLESDIAHLYHLLDVSVGTQQEMRYSGDPDQRRVDALIWIARDIVQGMLSQFSPEKSTG